MPGTSELNNQPTNSAQKSLISKHLQTWDSLKFAFLIFVVQYK